MMISTRASRGSSRLMMRRWNKSRKNDASVSALSLSNTMVSKIGDDDDERGRNKRSNVQQHRQYHTTPRQDMFLYATMALTAALSYVAYRKYNGEPLKPHGATNGQEAYRKMEEDLKKRNMKSKSKIQRKFQNKDDD